MISCLNFLDLKTDRRLRIQERRKLTLSQKKIDFASNDYLGFAKNPQLHSLFCNKIKKINQMGSAGSRLLTGNSLYNEELEKKIAAYHGEEAGLIFSSGYTANVGVLSALAGRDDEIIYDEKVHASIRDGIVLSRARNLSFRHNDVNHLEEQIKRCKNPPFVVIESLYSTDGSRAPLEDIAALCKDRLIVDEAHATGVFGPGLVTTSVLARIHTFSKALGVHGAIVLGKRTLIDYLITTSRPFIYSTALSMPQLLAIDCAYTLLKRSSISFPFPNPIEAIYTKRAKEIAQQSGEFDIRALLYPTVARGEECIRLCFHTYNTQEEVRRLYEWMDRCRD